MYNCVKCRKEKKNFITLYNFTLFKYGYFQGRRKKNILISFLKYQIESILVGSKWIMINEVPRSTNNRNAQLSKPNPQHDFYLSVNLGDTCHVMHRETLLTMLLVTVTCGELNQLPLVVMHGWNIGTYIHTCIHIPSSCYQLSNSNKKCSPKTGRYH